MKEKGKLSKQIKDEIMYVAGRMGSCSGEFLKMINVLKDHENIFLAVVPLLCGDRTPLMSPWRHF